MTTPLNEKTVRPLQKDGQWNPVYDKGDDADYYYKPDVELAVAGLKGESWLFTNTDTPLILCWGPCKERVFFVSESCHFCIDCTIVKHFGKVKP